MLTTNLEFLVCSIAVEIQEFDNLNNFAQILLLITLLTRKQHEQWLIQPSFNAMVYIRQRQLPKLHEYKYAGVDHSLVSKYILKPFYTHFVIKCFPMSMA